MHKNSKKRSENLHYNIGLNEKCDLPKKNLKKNDYLYYNLKTKLNLNNTHADLPNNSKFIDNKIYKIKKLFNDQKYVECEKHSKELIKSNFYSKKIYIILSLCLIKQNKLLESLNNYKIAIKQYGQDKELLINFGDALQKNGNYLKAVEKYKEALKIDPESVTALIKISSLYNLMSKHEEAVYFATKLTLSKSYADKGFCNLGNAYLGMNKIEEALSLYNKGLIHNKNSAQLNHNKALTLMLLKIYDEALKIFENGFKNNYLDNSSLIDYGLCLFECGKIKRSLEINEKALAEYPNNIKLLNNLGNLNSHIGYYEKANLYFTKAETLNPKNKEILYNIALSYHNQNLYDISIRYCKSAIEIDKDFFNPYNLLAMCYGHKNDIPKCLENYHNAIKLNPNSYLGWFNYGLFCLNHGRTNEALEALITSKGLGNQNPELDLLINNSKYNNLETNKSYLREIHKKLNTEKITPQQISSHLLTSLYSDELSPQKIFEMHKYFGKDNKSTKIKIRKNKNLKIRIGYVSADLNYHSVGYFFEPLIENHNLDKFEIFTYYNNNKFDDKNKILQGYCKNWRNVYEFDDDYLLNLIKNDRIDILVDLSGHTKGNRLEIFRKKPAFKQISWLGYPATTGLSSIDYKFTDITVDPLNTSENFYTEKLYRIEDSFLCYKNSCDTAISKTKPFEVNGFVTFGSFNNISKITEKNLKAWIAILKNVSDSQLVLKSHQFTSEQKTEDFIKFFKENDVDINRIKLLPFIKSTHGHLAMYNMVDICLDTFQFNGATTTMEAIWMGVPVITLTGEAHVSRVGTSILRNLNLNELIAEDVDDYIYKAKQLSKNFNRLQSYQNELRVRLKNSVLCDGQNFTTKIEKAYIQIFNES